MKRASIVLSGLLALATLSPAHADDWLQAKKGATFAGATAAGVALGGPLGLLGGGLLAAWLHAIAFRLFLDARAQFLFEFGAFRNLKRT